MSWRRLAANAMSHGSTTLFRRPHHSTRSGLHARKRCHCLSQASGPGRPTATEAQASRPWQVVQQAEELPQSTARSLSRARSEEGSVTPQPEPGPAVPPKLLLLLTAMLWGSYAPSLRLVFTSPGAPNPLVVMAVRGVLQAAVLLGASQLPLQGGRQGDGTLPAGAGQATEQEPAGSLLEQWLTLRSPPLWMAALELGLWNYAATALQTFGLQLTSATRASFLIQATALLTPLLATLGGDRPSRRVWGGCALALAGTLLITADKAAGTAGSAGIDTAGLHLGGDAAILLAALFYSLATVRITGYAQTLPSVKIAAGKSLILGGVAVVSCLAAATNTVQQGLPLLSLWEGYTDPATWAVLVWSALGPGALAAYFHVKGQRDVPPAEAQVIFSSVPLWSAAFAWLLLGGEQLGPLTWVGGGAVVAAGLLASTAPPGEKQEGSGRGEKNGGQGGGQQQQRQQQNGRQSGGWPKESVFADKKEP